MSRKIGTILYVESNVFEKENLISILEDFCETIYFAENGEIGLDSYIKHKPDLIVTDIHMPVMNGLEMTKKIKEINNYAKVIIITAFSEVNLLQEAISLHVESYLVKPFDNDLLIHVLSKTIASFYLEEELDNKNNYLIEQKEDLETIFSITSNGIAITDLESNFLHANKAFLNMLGYTLDELKSKNSINISVEEDKKNAKVVLAEVIKNGLVENYQKRYISKNNEIVYVDIATSLMPDKKRILLSTNDITNEVYQEKLLNEYLNMIDKNIITSSTDLEGTIIKVSDAFCKITGYKEKELIGKNHNMLRYEKTLLSNKVYKDLWDTIQRDETWTGEFKNRKKDGTFYWAKATIGPFYDFNGEKIGYTSLIEDITDKKLIEEISIKDGLTEIYNRRYFNDMFPKIVNGAKRNNDIVNFLILDIDHFKKYNDTYGHLLGDEALKKIAMSISKTLRRLDDYCFRLGGEEFGVLFKERECKNSLEFVNSIKENVEKLKIEHKLNNASGYVTFSGGLICKRASDIVSLDSLYKEADELLYKAKEEGRNRVISNLCV